MTRRQITVLLILLVVVGLAWVVLRPVPGPPRGATLVDAPRPEASVVTVPIELILSDLQASLERGTPQSFVDQRAHEVSDGLLLDLDAHREGPIRVGASKGALVADVPVAVFAKVYSERKADQRADRGQSEPAGTRVEGHLVVRARIAYALDDDWTLRSTTTLSHTWKSRPTLTWGPFRFGIQKLADEALAPRWPEIAAQMDASMAADTRTREAVERVWTELGTPRLVAEEPPTWWVGEPMALFATSPVVDPDAMRVVVGLQGRFALVVGDPGPAPAVPPLPPRADPPDSGVFRVALSTRMGWDALSAQATALLGSTAWTSPAGEATVRAVELYPSGDRVVVALSYEARHAWRTDGTLYVWGRPVVDSAARELRFEDVDVGVASWDDATATAGALAGRTLVEVLRDDLRFPFGDRIDDLRTRIEQGMAAPTARGDQLSGSVDALTVSGLRLADEAVVVDCLATGTLALRLASSP